LLPGRGFFWENKNIICLHKILGGEVSNAKSAIVISPRRIELVAACGRVGMFDAPKTPATIENNMNENFHKRTHINDKAFYINLFNGFQFFQSDLMALALYNV
jgi:hypothetical protein